MAQDPNVANLTRVMSLNPDLAYQPATASALAYSSAKDQDVTSTSAYLRGKKLTESLSMLPSEEQLRYWERMSQGDRNMAKASGYLLPIEAHEVDHQNSLEHGAGKLFGFIGKFTPNAAEKPLKSALNTYSDVVENTIQRGMRTILVGATDQGLGAGAFNLVRVDEWNRWWGEADKENVALDPKTEARIRDRFGDKVVDLAHYELKNPGYLGSTFESLVQSGDMEQAGRLDELMRSPEFNDAFGQVKNAQLSIGRAFADVVGSIPGVNGLEDNPKLFNILSGPIDAAWRLGTDPLNRLTSGKTANRRFIPNVVETGVPGIAQGRQAYTIPKFSETAAKAKIEDAFSGADKASENVIRYFDQAGAHLNTIRTNPGSVEAANALRELKSNFKNTWFMHDDMMKYGVKDAPSAKDYLLGDVGFRKVLSGDRATSLGLLPHRSAMSAQVRKLKPGSMVDFMEKGHLFANENFRAATNEIGADQQITAKAATDLTGKELDAWRNSFRGRMATAGGRLNNPTVQLDNSGQLNLLADDATEQVHRLARYYAPKFWADQVASKFTATDDIAARKNIVKGLLSTQAEATGILKTVEGKEWFNNYVKSIDQEMSGTYALGDVGKLANGERSAWLLEDARPTIPVPSFKEFHAQAAKVGFTKHLWGIPNSQMVDYFMTTIWRPMMLLRPATGIRNAIDEVANVVVRNGVRNWTTQRAELRVANRNQWESRKAAQATATSAKENANNLRSQFDAEFPAGAYEAKLTQLEAEVKDLRRMSQREDPTATPAEIAAKKAELKDLRKRPASIVKAEEEAQILHARFEGTKASFDPTAGRLYRMYANTAQFVTGKALGIAQMDKAHPFRVKLEQAARLESARDLYMSHVYGKLSDAWLKTMATNPENLTYLDDLVDDPFMRTRLEEDIVGSMRDSLAENMNKVDQIVKFPGKKGKYRYVQIKSPTEMSPANSSGARAWSQRLNKMADDEVAHLAMLHLDDEAKAIELMARSLRENPEYVKQLRTARDKSPEEFAAQVLTEVKAHLSDSAGNLNRELVDQMVQKAGGVRTLNRDAFAPEKLGELKMHQRPDTIIGRDGLLIEEGKSMYDLVQKSFTFFSEMTSFVSRHPQMVDEYLTFRSNLLPWQQSLEREMVAKGTAAPRAAELAKSQAHKAAVEEATLKVLSYVDNPAIRSQASVLFRNLAPFYRAQEEFFRRWARTMKYSPEMFAKANLYLDGMDNSGMMFTDSDGTKYFTYPGTKVMSEAMAKVGNAFGLPMDILPVPVPMTGQVNMLAPGFQSDTWTKVFNGPIHSIPVAVLENMTGNPRLAEFQRGAYGKVAAGQPWYMGLIPSAIRPAFDAYTNPDDKMFAAMKQASAYLIANGDVPTNDPKSRQEWLEKLRRHARGIMVYKAVMAPLVPAAPRIGTSSAPTTPTADQISQAEGMRYIDDRYHRLIEKVGWEDAYGYWMKAHPDEVPFLIGGTEGESTAHLPMTTAALQFMDENRAVMTRYKKASSFLIPQEPGDTNMDSWQLAMDLGIRKFKDINTYVDDVLKANDMSFYYEQKTKFDNALVEAKSSGTSTTPLREEWSKWKDQWLPFHPLVEAEILDGQVRDTNRQETLAEFRDMLNDPDVPRTPQLDVMRQLVDGYSRLEAAIAPIKSARDDYSLGLKDTYRANFQKWAQETAAGNPGAQMMVDRIFKYMD